MISPSIQPKHIQEYILASNLLKKINIVTHMNGTRMLSYKLIFSLTP